MLSRESTQSSTSQPASPGTTSKEEENEEVVRRHDKNISPSLAAAAAVAAGQLRPCLCACLLHHPNLSHVYHQHCLSAGLKTPILPFVHNTSLRTRLEIRPYRNGRRCSCQPNAATTTPTTTTFLRAGTSMGALAAHQPDRFIESLCCRRQTKRCRRRCAKKCR